MTVPGADPERQHLEQDLEAADFEAGAGAGYWRLVRLDWPRLTVAVACGDGNELGLRITVDGYPALAPAGEPWDLLEDKSLPASAVAAGRGLPAGIPPGLVSGQRERPVPGLRPDRAQDSRPRLGGRAAGPGLAPRPDNRLLPQRSPPGPAGNGPPATRCRPVNAARHGLTMDKSLFTQLAGELARRGRGERETGAFLLARAGHPRDGSRRPPVVAVAYYDDLDPGCLTGGITFTADGYTALAALCRRDGLQVVADIHTHPGRNVRQSPTDAAHPMTALPGHIALIAPRYARGVTSPADLGVHVLQAGGSGDPPTAATPRASCGSPRPAPQRAAAGRNPMAPQPDPDKENLTMTLRPDGVHRTVLLAAHDGTQPTLDAAIAAHDRTGIVICADKQTCRDASGQAAILTAVVTARRAFGTVTMHAEDPAAILTAGVFKGRALADAVASQGARLLPPGPRRGSRGVARAAPRTGHACPSGKAPHDPAGLMARMDRESSARRLPGETAGTTCVLAPIAAAALGVSEAFGAVRSAPGSDAGYRDIALNLWNPGADHQDNGPGPLPRPGRLVARRTRPPRPGQRLGDLLAPLRRPLRHRGCPAGHRPHHARQLQHRRPDTRRI